MYKTVPRKDDQENIQVYKVLCLYCSYHAKKIESDFCLTKYELFSSIRRSGVVTGNVVNILTSYDTQR